MISRHSYYVGDIVEGHLRRSGVVISAKLLAILRATDWVAWIQEGKVRAACIDLKVLLLRRRTDLEFSIIRCLS
jgi:hypothetical protein